MFLSNFISEEKKNSCNQQFCNQWSTFIAVFTVNLYHLKLS